MTATERVVHCDPDIMSGAAVFVGTRVPVKTLFDYLSHGHPLAEFFGDFPTVEPGQALAALHQGCELLVEKALAAPPAEYRPPLGGYPQFVEAPR